jgi:hypothetical protein
MLSSLARRVPAVVRGVPPAVLATRAVSTAVVNPSVNAHDPWSPPTLDAKSNTVDLGAISPRHW